MRAGDGLHHCGERAVHHTVLFPTLLRARGLYLAPLPVLLLISLGIVGEGSAGPYLLCLLSYLLAGGIAFFRVMASFIAAVRE